VVACSLLLLGHVCPSAWMPLHATILVYKFDMPLDFIQMPEHRCSVSAIDLTKVVDEQSRLEQTKKIVGIHTKLCSSKIEA